MAVIGGFRSDLSITCMIGGNLKTFPRVFSFRKSRINENGGKIDFVDLKNDSFGICFVQTSCPTKV